MAEEQRQRRVVVVEGGEARNALEAVAALTSEAVFTCGNFIREVRQRTGQ